MSATPTPAVKTQPCDICGTITVTFCSGGIEYCHACLYHTKDESAVCEYCGIEDDTVEDVEDLYSERLIPTCARCQADTVVKDARA